MHDFSKCNVSAPTEQLNEGKEQRERSVTICTDYKANLARASQLVACWLLLKSKNLL